MTSLPPEKLTGIEKGLMFFLFERLLWGIVWHANCRFVVGSRNCPVDCSEQPPFFLILLKWGDSTRREKPVRQLPPCALSHARGLFRLSRVSLDRSRIKEKERLHAVYLSSADHRIFYFCLSFLVLVYTSKIVEVWNSLSKQGLSRSFPGLARNSGHLILSSHT